MDPLWPTILWEQFGAAIDMLDDSLLACPDALWREHLWRDPPASDFPPQFSEFWHVAYHALVWLDLYLSGVPEEEFAPPAPFVQGELDSAEALPAQPYTKEELRAYLASTREKCRTTLAALTDEQAHQPVDYPWMRGAEVVTYAELQLYTMRHVQEHAAQLSLFLGQHGIHLEESWVARAKDDRSN